MHLTKPFTSLFLALLLSIAAAPCQAKILKGSKALTTPIQAFSLTAENRTRTGLDWQTVLSVSLDMVPDWYTYAHVPGGMGKPTTLTGTTADGKALAPLYPEGHVKPDSYDPSVMVNVYPSGTRLFLGVPTDSQSPFPLDIRLDLLLCHPTRCVPVRRDMPFDPTGLTLPRADSQPWWPEFLATLQRSPAASVHGGQSSTETMPQSITGLNDTPVIEWNFTPIYLQPGLEVGGLVSAILMGLLAGLILNIMPCVLPVISLKLTALLNSSNMEKESDRIRAFREHNIFFALGVLTFFMILATVLGATGQAWGALFQKQWLVLTVAGVVFVLSLSLFGLFHLPIIDLKFGVESRSPRVQAFFTGNLTTLLATPCSGPFLGGVLSWSLVQGPLALVTVFASIGLGMASPYLLMVLNPGLSRFLPRSGPWIEYVEKAIAFFLVGTAFYLVGIALGGMTLRILLPLWAILLGGWLWTRTRNVSTGTRWGVRGASLALLVVLVVWTSPAPVSDQFWEPFDPVQLHDAIGKAPLFVDFTADWCPTCKVLEATVLTAENITRWKQEYGITFIKVDLTERNIEGEALLQALGSKSIPAAALFSPGGRQRTPLVLRDLYTRSQLENILRSWEK
jgi:thiol:disulfide interchange protein DsbD